MAKCWYRPWYAISAQALRHWWHRYRVVWRRAQAPISCAAAYPMAATWTFYPPQTGHKPNETTVENSPWSITKAYAAARTAATFAIIPICSMTHGFATKVQKKSLMTGNAIARKLVRNM